METTNELPSARVILQALEGVISMLKYNNYTELEIHKIVELTLHGHIKNGEFTEEYKVYARTVEDTSPSSIILLNQ